MRLSPLLMVLALDRRIPQQLLLVWKRGSNIRSARTSRISPYSHPAPFHWNKDVSVVEGQGSFSFFVYHVVGSERLTAPEDVSFINSQIKSIDFLHSWRLNNPGKTEYPCSKRAFRKESWGEEDGNTKFRRMTSQHFSLPTASESLFAHWFLIVVRLRRVLAAVVCVVSGVEDRGRLITMVREQNELVGGCGTLVGHCYTKCGTE